MILPNREDRVTVNPIGQGRVQQAIANAATRTGIDFDYLMGQAKVESGLNANARAGTSSASGLYQFVEQSWLAVVKKHGAEHGLGWAANNISQTAGGRYTVGDGATRSAILALRNDPTAASLMAAEHASDNKDVLEGSLGRSTNGTDKHVGDSPGRRPAARRIATDRPGTRRPYQEGDPERVLPHPAGDDRRPAARPQAELGRS